MLRSAGLERVFFLASGKTFSTVGKTRTEQGRRGESVCGVERVRATMLCTVSIYRSTNSAGKELEWNSERA